MIGSRLRRAWLVGALSALASALATASEPSPPRPEHPFLRGSDEVIVPLAPRPCDTVEYLGPRTLLYADRPYHTEALVPELVGLRFCRGKRHGQALWILEVERPTTVYAVASEHHALEADGWAPLDSAVRVAAAGLVLDRLYAKRLVPGRYALRYGRATTAHPIFWNPHDAHMADPAGG